MESGKPRMGDLRVVRTELNNGSINYKVQEYLPTSSLRGAFAWETRYSDAMEDIYHREGTQVKEIQVIYESTRK